jgi:hypothetical protein
MTDISITSDFNLAIPVQETDTRVLWIHSKPVSKEIFKKFFMPLSKAFSQLHAEGINVLAGPKVAAYLLEEIAENMGQGAIIRAGFINEIRRITTVCVLGDKAWETMPLEVAAKRNKMSEDLVDEATAAAVFFTLNWHGLPRQARKMMIQMAADLHNWQLTSLDSTAWADSLPISTTEETTPAVTSSVPH